MNSLTQNNGERYLSCIDCGTPKQTLKSKKSPRCNVCENKRRAVPVVDGKKLCTVCGQNKDIFRFGKKGGSICMECQTSRSLEWNKNNKEKKNENNKKSRLNNLERARLGDKKYYENNREKHLEYSREYYSTHKDALAQYKQKWISENKDKKTIQSHRRRALKLSVENTLTAKEWTEIKDSYLNKCVYCGAKATEQDHLVPFFQGGANVAENVVPACKTCNTKKGKKSLLQFFYYLIKNGK